MRSRSRPICNLEAAFSLNLTCFEARSRNADGLPCGVLGKGPHFLCISPVFFPDISEHHENMLEASPAWDVAWGRGWEEQG